MKDYRIVKQTLRNGNVIFRVEMKNWPAQEWLLITERDELQYAQMVVEKLRGSEVIASEIVE